MDAHVGVEALGLSFMAGEKPHAGFPEVGYAAAAARLARAGHRVVVVEQTETPDGLAARNEARKRAGLKREAVVRREAVAVLTCGTLADAELLGDAGDAQLLMAVAELPAPVGGDGEGEAAGGRVWVGAAAADAATGQVLVGQWLDDPLRSRLRAALTALAPVELVLPEADADGGGATGAPALSAASRRVVAGVAPGARVNRLPAGAAPGAFWGAADALRELAAGGYYAEEGAGATTEDGAPPKPSAPAALAALRAAPGAHAAAAAALGGLLSYLRASLLDRRVLAAGRVGALAEAYGVGEPLGEPQIAVAGTTSAAPARAAGPACVALDGPALENLEVLENTEGGVAGTLLAALDHCATPFGRRRLRQWVCRPLARAAEIRARQGAVADLLGPAEGAAADARRALAGLADLERLLARLGAAGAGAGPAREAPGVVLYEDVAAKRVRALCAALRGLRRLGAAAAAVAAAPGVTSQLLLDLVVPGRNFFPDLEGPLAALEGHANWAAADASGRLEPAPGADPAYDAAGAAVAAAEGALEAHLKDVRAELRCAAAKYVSLNKEPHVLELPESVEAPRGWEAMQGKKGVRRYMSPALRGRAAALAAALEARDAAGAGLLQRALARFAARGAAWAAAVDATAQLDALLSLAVAAASGDGDMCRPEVLDEGAPGPPAFRACALRHPALVGGAAGGAFVPNDIELGGAGGAAPFMVLTGPNMGGKSTLMRQVCLAALAAQVGAWVPATSLALTPADAVFVRMGARDRILLGQSTFMVELSEAAAALARATPRSLVALDELGRGTSTHDGAAIASAVLDHLACVTRCRGVFATHYHHVADAHAADPAVALRHMACAVAPPAAAGGAEEVTFTYRLAPGAAPRSHGANVARLAGLPEAVIRRAVAVSGEFEAGGGWGSLPAAAGGGAGGALAAAARRAAAAARAAAAGGGAAALRAAQAEARAALGDA
jgi:DNA mismatch repair protein MSH6